ncbi:MAG: efflux RND transporter periplasmic adaptor subunit [Bacteroidales bacterium]|nr:efflux RND transporter periplasmic adaptor subunit [Bacteroidales bacterium]
MNKEQKSLWLGIGVVIAVVAVVAIIGIFALQPEPEMITGEVCADEYRVANKVPGRLSTLFVEEGQQVRAGDTLAYISSPEVDAKMQQARAARAAATAQSSKAQNGAREQQVASAYEMWQKAEVGVDIAKKSYDRVQQLYDKKVVSAQKRDEAEAQYKAAVATANAAKLQYEMAREGAQNEDKEAANALVQQAQGAVSEVEAYVQDRYLLAPCDGEVAEIYAKRSDLIGTGSPVMSILDMSNVWISVSVREDMLGDLRVGSLAEIKIPALGDQTYTARVTYLRAMASYAVWRATKINGQYDVKSFDVKLVPQEPIDGLRPGMTAIVVNE